jgi:hypothetical protein
VRDQITSRTDGVPLFIEELTKTVLESGLLREADDHFELTGPLPPLAIPSTLHASLLARLDRLAAVKDVAQIGAVIGREFSYALVAAVAALPEKDLNAALAQLIDAELIYQWGVPPDATYQFKHALVQDASYASLVRSRRQHLHSAISRALEERFPDIVATEPETLAHHCSEAGLTQSALSYWLKAGRRATERSAYPEALSHLERGLAIRKAQPESPDRDRQELDYQIALYNPISAVRGFASPEFEARSERATVLSEKLGDVQRLDASLSAQFIYCNVTGKNRKAREVAERCRTLAMRQGDRAMQLSSHHVMGMSLMHELATNAAKYGAFSKPDGRLLLRWWWLPNASGGRLAIGWQELDGPPVVKPSQFGYGTSTIRELIPFELGGTIDLAFASSGLQCHLEIPADWFAGPLGHATLTR